MKACMAFRTSESLTVILQRTEPPTEGEWQAFLADFAGQDLSTLRVLIMTDGGGPTAMQRATLKTLMAGRSVRAAVVSDSIKVRFIVATIALINPVHHCFTGGERAKAYEFLGLTSAEQARADTTIRQLNALVA
jgi:hypothetical protein